MDILKLCNTLTALQEIDTPTVCNALELIEPDRKNYGYTDEMLHCMYPNMKPVCGIAKTATCRSFRPSNRDGPTLKQDRVKYYTYINDGHYPKIVIMQDLDGPHRSHGPFWGEFNTRIHKSLGCIGIVTDGSIRDVPNLPNDIQLLSKGIKPSHGNVHIVDYDIQVNVADMVVVPDDIVHADIHGAVTFPVAWAEEVIVKAKEFVASEEPILEACRNNPNLTLDEIIELYLKR